MLPIPDSDTVSDCDVTVAVAQSVRLTVRQTVVLGCGFCFSSARVWLCEDL